MCSCSKVIPLPGSVNFEPERYINSDFNMNSDGYEIAGNVKVFSYEDIVFSFTYPEGLSYLTLRVSSDGYFADIGGSQDEIAPEDLPDNAPVKLFAEGLRAFLFQQNEFTENQNGTYSCGREILGETVKATFTAEGKITQIVCGNIIISLNMAEGTESVG